MGTRKNNKNLNVDLYVMKKLNIVINIRRKHEEPVVSVAGKENANSVLQTAAIGMEEVVTKLEKKYGKREQKLRNQVESLIRRVELLYGQVTDQRIQVEKLRKDRNDYKARFETEQREKSQLQKNMWRLESNLDQEQFKRDQLELKMQQLKNQISDLQEKHHAGLSYFQS